MSFFSLDFYKDVGLLWKGTCFPYLFLLLAICWVPFLIQNQLSVIDYVQNKAPALVDQIPPIRIINGEAVVDVSMPYKITDPESGKVLALIDTTGQTVSLEGTEAKILLKKVEVIIRKNDIETRSMSFKKIEHFTLDKEKVSGRLTIFRNYGSFVVFVLAIIGSFAFRVMQVLVYAAIGLLFAKWLKTKRPYLALLRLSVMALTPVIIVSTIIDLTHAKIPLNNLLCFIAAMVYLYLGVKAIACQEKVEEGVGDAPQIQADTD